MELKSWTFRHPDFQAERRDALENIKRKVPTQRKTLPSQTTPTTPHTATTQNPQSSASPSPSHTAQLQSQVERLTRAQEEMTHHITSLEKNYQNVLIEMVQFQKGMAAQDQLLQHLIQYFLNWEGGECVLFLSFLSGAVAWCMRSGRFYIVPPHCDRVLIDPPHLR